METCYVQSGPAETVPSKYDSFTGVYIWSKQNHGKTVSLSTILMLNIGTGHAG